MCKHEVRSSNPVQIDVSIVQLKIMTLHFLCKKYTGFIHYFN